MRSGENRLLRERNEQAGVILHHFIAQHESSVFLKMLQAVGL
jgi:hypothetical protein